ncbi:hypothetical protein [Rhodoplanes sp. Z2-YC6860]|uniref:hypothetical protein n=1 Tax=Rhodoplanes sp. Z2-YC6860 TaxID=674703 RepID=UPI0012EE57AD|nr:hypothetical protein [Rhodoplanes sp. Z2-YC6860]
MGPFPDSRQALQPLVFLEKPVQNRNQFTDGGLALSRFDLFWHFACFEHCGTPFTKTANAEPVRSFPDRPEHKVTHAELARMAKENLRTFAQSLVPADALRKVIAAHEIVFALFPDSSPRGWDLHIIKGKSLVVGATDEALAKISTTAVPCADLTEALAMEQALGDGRPH